jgi:polar amino acid transport system substrate-binding protein
MRRMRLWLLLALAGLLAIGGVAAGCGGDDDNDTDVETDEPATAIETGDLELIQDGQLLVGTDAPFPPFEIGRPPDVTGFDIEVMDAIAERLGLETEYVNASFDTIFRDVAQGQFDIVAAASTITEDRERTVDFSDPYYEAQQALVVQEGEEEIASVSDVAGRTVGVQDATTGEEYARNETDAETVRPFPEGPDAIAALATGQVDAVIIDHPVAIDAVEQQGGLEVAEEIPTEELYGFAMAEESENLRLAVNEALTEMKEDGTLTELYDKYFNIEPPASVLEGTHEPS